ncbi:hypothetical protein MRB53_038344 [Persea americana]|nr:hypothetical protein MRB53_038344 [Persea americana]
MTKSKKRGPNQNHDKNVERLTNALEVFTLHYGCNETKLHKWQALCDDCGVARGGSIRKCKIVSMALTKTLLCNEADSIINEAIKAVAINIWDLIEARKRETVPAPRYTDKTSLRQDLRTHPSRRFPLSMLKGDNDNKLLRALLVTLG